MGGFRLIGIRPEKDCGQKFCKILEPGKLYTFCNEYDFYIDDQIFDQNEGVINGYRKNQVVPSTLYRVGNLDINITALVGKNGSGKSTLIELLLYGIYLIGRNTQDKNTGKNNLPTYTESLQAEIESVSNQIETLKNSIENFKKYIDSYLKRLSQTKIRRNYFENKIFDFINEIQDLNVYLDSAISKSRYLKAELALSDELNDSLKDTFYDCSIFYELNDVLFEVRINSKVRIRIIKNLEIENNNGMAENDLLDNFFYSMILNYSHHSLNPENVGYWINSLFHKNDGYKTPAVINPMREEGIIPINNELKLAKGRLLTNLAFQKLNDLSAQTMLTDKQKIKFITLSLKDQDERNVITLNFDSTSQTYKPSSRDVITINMIMDISGEYPILASLMADGVRDEEKNITERTLQYLLYKVKKIQMQYPEYIVKVVPTISSESDKIIENRSTIKLLLEDYSHVSYKFHQAIYFLTKILDGSWNKELRHKDGSYKLTLESLLQWMKITNNENQIIESDYSKIFGRIPPSIFSFDFDLSDPKDNDKSSMFSDLSSGEQQKIHLINAFLYHLNNAYSVHKESSGKRQKYDFFNVVFDEIELYFHPEYQRTFVSDLLTNISYYKHLTDATEIKGLNILFSTHSPFILSDIPSEKVLKLDDGKPKFDSNGRNSFAANIHDLLDDEFFLSMGSMGEFAKQKINETIHFLTYQINQKEIDDLKRSGEILEYQTKKVEALISENNYIESLISVDADKSGDYEKIVNIIGEPVLKSKLQEMFNMTLKNNHNA